MAEGKIYVAKADAVVAMPDGSYVNLRGGFTRVREGHPLLEGREALFQKLDVHYDLEDTRSAPEEEKVVPKPDPPKEQVETKAEEPAGLTSKDAPQPQPRGRRRVTKTD